MSIGLFNYLYIESIIIDHRFYFVIVRLSDLYTLVSRTHFAIIEIILHSRNKLIVDLFCNVSFLKRE